MRNLEVWEIKRSSWERESRMSFQSMTGFGKGELEGERYRLSVELKSVNHRFKDMRFKMGNVFNSEEISLRQKIEKNFKRGSFDIFINYKKAQTSELKLVIDEQKVEAFIEKMQGVLRNKQVSMTVNPTDFLRSDFAIEDDEKEEELKGMVSEAFDKALENLSVSRQEEGLKLLETLKSHRDEYIKHFKIVESLKDSYQANVKDKLTKRFSDDGQELKVDESRFMQEVIYYLEKLDIQEEISRINIHLEKLDGILNTSQEEAGRQIDFLVQELNRETNTIGSKSGSSEISENVVQMKVQLEKIREQALNLQ